ncbi:glutaredoxin family protein [Sediminibacillus massiliensis]|uniref:glutaredoxin family protein n=1 Tax=Sediminibacillus massiliensis TaxID=1926277 RepID=UPI0031832D3D
MVLVTLYTKENCPLCDEAKELLQALRMEEDFELEEVDIYQDDQLLEEYQLMIPVVAVEGQDVDYGQINLSLVEEKIKSKRK